MNDALRAAVFARDKAICSFSGLSVWYLDYGAAPFSHADWVDHVKPKSRGGQDTLDNLVCASFFYNRKKLNNGSDSEYLFSGGSPTETFFFTHGEISPQQAALLESHKQIHPSDWYFNRAIFNIMVAIGDELAKANVVRTSEYWLGSARKRMDAWKKLSKGVPSFKSRRLVRFPNAEDVKLMLSLCDASDQEWKKIYKELLKFARINHRAVSRFVRADRPKMRREVIRKLRNENSATAPTMDVLSKNVRLL
jgi:hypothetical protein